MIRRFFCVLLALACICGAARAEDMPDLVRLHVIASDDSPEAQALKLELRDACLRCAQICLSDAPDADAAYMRLEEHVDAFERTCRMRARELGYEGPVTAETGSFDFPDRIYGSVPVPAGKYRALRITIGEGEGRNWWCILYPTLCMLNEAETAADGSNAKNILAWLRARMGGK